MSSSHKGERFDVDVLSQAEVARLIETFNKRLFNGARNRAMVAVMYRAGLRVSELCDLRPSHLDLQVGLVRVQNGKGGKGRFAGIDTATAAYVHDWLQRRDAGSNWLFHTRTGKRVDPRHMRAMLKRYARRAGIDKRVHPHGLRHTHACELAREGVPINVIQKQLGHSNVAVTSTYLNHIAADEVVQTMQQRDWTAA